MKQYYILGYQNGIVQSMTKDGFSDLSLALEMLQTIDKAFNAFVSIRLV